MGFPGLTDRLNMAVMAHLADDESAIYFKEGGPAEGVPIPVIIERDVEVTQAGQQSTTLERRTELTGFHSDIGGGRRHELVTVNGEGWRLDRRDRDDGQFCTWWVVPATP